MRRIVLAVLVGFGGPTFGFAQVVRLGAMGGVPLSGPLRPFAFDNDESKRYVVGPTVEIRLPAGFALEVDALYRRAGNSFSFLRPPDAVFLNRQRTDSWELPVLGKYYFQRRSSRWRPLVASGYALRMTRSQIQSFSFFRVEDEYRTISSSGSTKARLDLGVAAAAGARIGAGRLTFSPQFRYARWAVGTDRFTQNQVDFLLGIQF